jgi:hypothetical protein
MTKREIILCLLTVLIISHVCSHLVPIHHSPVTTWSVSQQLMHRTTAEYNFRPAVCPRAVELVHRTSDSDSSIFKCPTPS